MNRTEVKRFTSKMLGANCYLLFSGNDCVIIDPCVKPEIIDKFVKDRGLKPVLVLITHSHIDHILYVNEVCQMYQIETAVHKDDFNEFTQNNKNGSNLFGFKKELRKPDRILENMDKFTFGSLSIKVISTPGHTPGSVSFLCDNMVFTGDTLFYLSIGRTDLGRGSSSKIMHSLKEELMELPDETIVYPGHGTFTSIGFEKENNPFII